jgi:hypothetical protein
MGELDRLPQPRLRRGHRVDCLRNHPQAAHVLELDGVRVDPVDPPQIAVGNAIDTAEPGRARRTTHEWRSALAELET